MKNTIADQLTTEPSMTLSTSPAMSSPAMSSPAMSSPAMSSLAISMPMHSSSRRGLNGFVAYENALLLLRTLAPVVEEIRQYNADLADQVTRAGTSITLNLQEGTGRAGRDRRRFFTMARGSAKEILGALDTADAWGWRVETTEARRVLDRELALLWGLCNGRKAP